ncbi:phosphoenolpyruvate--protein phosphotransferase [Thermodesulfobacteriota bacterium]
MGAEQQKERILKGIGGSPGICIGRAYLVDKEGTDVIEKYHIDKDKLEIEKSRFKDAVEEATKDLRAVIKDIPAEMNEHARILEVHVLLLKDKMLYTKTIETIEAERVNAEWALKKVVAERKAMFQSVADSYLKERAADIDHVSESIMQHLSGVPSRDIRDIDKRVILVARNLSPAETCQIRLERIKGFITELGGKESHTCIIAKTLGIPVVTGLVNATNFIPDDEIIIVDGTAGAVIINPAKQTIKEYRQRQSEYGKNRADIVRKSRFPAETSDGIRLPILGNIELPEEVVAVLDFGGEGIGLFRTEFQYLGRSELPGEDELFEKYRDIAEVMESKPVTIRTLDIEGSRLPGDKINSVGKNPALGLRGIRYCLKRPDIFKTQLRAILRASIYGKIRILFPLISNLEEIREAKSFLKISAESLEREGIPYNRNVEIGIMIEVPSAVIMADTLAKNVDFFSIGTNDLIQYSLAIDRGNREVAYLFHPFHPAIMRMLKHVVEVAKDTGIKVSICGEMASDPICAPFLVGLGLDELSMNPQSIPLVKNIIREVSFEDCKQLVQEVLKKRAVEEIFQILKNNYEMSMGENDLTHKSLLGIEYKYAQ